MSRSVRMLSAIAALSAIIVLSGCASLIAPTVATDPGALRAGQYSLDQSHAAMLFKIEHFGLSSYIGRFNSFDASLDFEPEDPASANLEAVIDIGSLDINNPELRDNLLGASWLDQAKYPKARLSTDSVRPLADGKFKLFATLVWRGVSKPVEVIVVFNGGTQNPLTRKYTVGFSATTSFLRSDFGMKTFLPLVGDRVEIEVHAEFQKD